MHLPFDLRYFEALDRIVQVEPWLTRVEAVIDNLKLIGIEKGKPFRLEGMSTFFANPEAYPLDDRGVAYILGFFARTATRKERISKATTPIVSTFRPMRRPPGTGRRHSRIERRMPSFAT